MRVLSEVSPLCSHSSVIIWLRQMTHADWLISGLEKVILPSEEIHLALSCKHCSNKILNKLKLIMPYNDDENYSTSEYYYPEQTNDPNKYGRTFSSETVFWSFLQSHNKLQTNKARYNKCLIHLVCSICTGNYCSRFLSHRPRSFVAWCV